MKRLISAALALTLIGTTAASAQSYRGSAPAQNYSHNNGATLALGLFALGGLAIIASQNNRNHAPAYNQACSNNNRYGSYYNNGRSNGYGNQCASPYSNGRNSYYGNQNYGYGNAGQYNRNDTYGRSSYYGNQTNRNDGDQDDYGYNRGGR